MKNLLITSALKTLSLFLLFLTVSCNDKDDIKPDGLNTELDNVKYQIKNGFIQNGGAVDYYLDDEAEVKTHFNYNFILTDGTPVFEEGNVVSMNDGKIIISTVLLSPGTTGFKTGVFEYDNFLETLEMEEEELLERYANKYFFPMAFVFTDTDGDKNWQEETGELVTGGTIKVSGTAPTYTIEYDLTLANNRILKGKYSGRFNVVED